MKKIFFVMAVVVMLMACLCVTAYASDGSTETVFSRIWEFALDNKETLASVAGFAAVFIASIVEASKTSKKSKEISDDVKVVLNGTSTVANSQGGVIGAVNELIGSYNSLKETYDSYEGAEDDRNKLVGVLVMQTTAILEILTAVYANSKNLPQGVKDIVNLKYARLLKGLESDETLRACVEMVRKGILGGGEEDGVAEEDSTEVEQGETAETARFTA